MGTLDHVPGAGLHGASVYGRLLAEIRGGTLQPGARLTETEIAARLGVSRTPVREAIRRLESDGLVSHRPRAGAIVRRLDHAETMELYEMRCVLEGTAARLAAGAAGEAKLVELEAINTEMAAATEEGKRAALNRQFHDALARAARNRFLLRSAGAVSSALMVLGPSTMSLSDRAGDAVREHAGILAAIRARDGVEAEALMRAHIEGAQKVRVRMRRGLSEEDGS